MSGSPQPSFVSFNYGSRTGYHSQLNLLVSRLWCAMGATRGVRKHVLSNRGITTGPRLRSPKHSYEGSEPGKSKVVSLLIISKLRN